MLLSFLRNHFLFWEGHGRGLYPERVKLPGVPYTATEMSNVITTTTINDVQWPLGDRDCRLIGAASSSEVPPAEPAHTPAALGLVADCVVRQMIAAEVRIDGHFCRVHRRSPPHAHRADRRLGGTGLGQNRLTPSADAEPVSLWPQAA
jgi:hypothetical protein